MKTYVIHNSISGAIIGTYEADSVEGALDAMAVGAGYESFADADDCVPVESGELVVREVSVLGGAA